MAEHLLLCELEDNRKAGLLAIEILASPSIKVLPEFSASKEANEIYQLEMTNLLAQITKEFLRSEEDSLSNVELALEYALISYAVQNQPYAAGIRCFIVLRAIGETDVSVRSILQDTADLFESLLRAESYFFERTDLNTIPLQLSNTEHTAAIAVVKEDRIHSLQSPSMTACFSFDRIATTDFSRKRLFAELTQYPDSYVSFQLIPSEFSDQERNLMTGCSQLLNNMVRGISDQGTPINVSYSAARPDAETYSFYADRAFDGMYNYVVYVEGNKDSSKRIAQTIMREYAGNASLRTSLKSIQINPVESACKDNPCTLPWIISELVKEYNNSVATYQERMDYNGFIRFPYLVTAEEAAALFHLPIGDETVGAGLVINESSHSNKAYNSDVINAGDIYIGTIKSSAREDFIGMTLKDFTKHMLVTGTPGSGKTTFLVGLLDRLWKKHHIPFLVIEPAKNEYRALIQSIPDIQIFTPGKSDISPFVFNPFLPPRNVRLETFKPALLAAFSAAVSMSTPLDKIFEDSINNCYGNHHWFDHYTTGDGADVFGIADFIACFQRTFETIGYTGDARNIGRAGVVRLRSLANLFDCYNSIPIEHLLERPTVIELSALESSDQKALIIALLLLAILNYVNANRLGDGNLHNVILLEEAHVLMDAQSGNRSGDADPAAVAQKLIVRMLAEIRSYGVSMILADQSPRKVGSDVIALTDAKLAFRLVETVDRQMIADSTGLSSSQCSRLPKLKPGEAMLFFGRLDEPEEVKIPDYRLENKISISLSDKDIRDQTQYWKSNAELLRPYIECKQASECEKACSYKTRMIAREIARRIHLKEFSDVEIAWEHIQNVITKLYSLIDAELLCEKRTRQMTQCVTIHLLRLLRYNNKVYREKKMAPNGRQDIPITVDAIGKAISK